MGKNRIRIDRSGIFPNDTKAKIFTAKIRKKKETKTPAEAEVKRDETEKKEEKYVVLLVHRLRVRMKSSRKNVE